MLSKSRKAFNEVKADFTLLLLEIRMNGYKAGLRKVLSYFQGTIRRILFPYMPVHIREQVFYRFLKARCAFEGRCMECGCTIPDLFYADNSCGGVCYPEMMNKSEWKKFKIENDVQINGHGLRKRL